MKSTQFAIATVLPLRTRNMSSPNNAATDEVLKIYRAATKTSLNEHQDAFDGAVGVYRARNQDASEKVARRVVERIICNSL
jgi:hypothetical protein